VAGEVTWPPRGKLGFGYDAIFQPIGHSQSFGEIDPAAKHAMSHRANAFAQLIAQVFSPQHGT
jgi:XTP/dITP diphosphohydrolase